MTTIEEAETALQIATKAKRVAARKHHRAQAEITKGCPSNYDTMRIAAIARSTKIELLTRDMANAYLEHAKSLFDLWEQCENTMTKVAIQYRVDVDRLENPINQFDPPSAETLKFFP